MRSNTLTTMNSNIAYIAWLKTTKCGHCGSSELSKMIDLRDTTHKYVLVCMRSSKQNASGKSASTNEHCGWRAEFSRLVPGELFQDKSESDKDQKD